MVKYKKTIYEWSEWNKKVRDWSNMRRLSVIGQNGMKQDVIGQNRMSCDWLQMCAEDVRIRCAQTTCSKGRRRIHAQKIFAVI